MDRRRWRRILDRLIEPIHRSVSTCSFPHILGDGKGTTRSHVFHSGKEGAESGEKWLLSVIHGGASGSGGSFASIIDLGDPRKEDSDYSWEVKFVILLFSRYKMVLDRDGWVLQLLENRRLFLIDGGGRKL